MEREYKNYFGSMILSNQILLNKLLRAFNLMKQEEHLIVSTNDYKAYMYEDKDNKEYYLVMDSGIITSVYREEKGYSKPFQKLIDGDEDSLKYSAHFLISIFNSKETFKKNEKIVQERLSIYPQEIREQMRGTTISMMDIPEQQVKSNPYEIKLLLDFLETNGFSNNFDREFLYNNPLLNNKVQERIPEITIVLEQIREALKNNNITEKNKFEYNDMDNYIWKNAQYIVSTEQNFSWVIDFKDTKNFTVYTALCSSNGNGSKMKSVTGLLKKVKFGDILDDIDYVGMRIENGNVQYVNNAFIYSLDMNIMLNKNVLENENLLIVDYGDTDIKSFDYQFAYANKKHGTDKVDFLIHALFVLGNGFKYDAQEGKIYTNAPYIPHLLDNFHYKETENDKKKLTSLIYIAPKNLQYLDNAWLENLKYIVEKIKKDKPDLTSSHTNGNLTPKQVLKQLENVIKMNDNLRKTQLKV